jgi:hypothetical protein
VVDGGGHFGSRESLSWITSEPLSQDNFLGAGPLSWMAFRLLSQYNLKFQNNLSLCSSP